VTNSEHEFVVAQQVSMRVEVQRDGVIELVSRTLSPLDETSFVRKPTGRPDRW
jgi:hypothetical protein